MKSTRRLLLGIGLAFLVNSGAFAGSLSLSGLVVPSQVTAGKGYTVEIPFTATGNVRIISVSYYWDNEGPFTMGTRGNKTRLINKLRTGNPRTYKLSAVVNYSSDGQLKKTNRVSAKLVVKP